MFARRFLRGPTSLRSPVVIKFDLLQRYLKANGHLSVPSKFVVHQDNGTSSLWPAESIGYGLGKHVAAIRTSYKKGMYPPETMARLDDMGFVRSAKDLRDKRLLLAFKTYKEKFGTGKMTKRFCVSETDETWPAETQGMKLGKVLNEMRRRRTSYLGIREQVAEMGFVLEPERAEPDFERSLTALQAFKRIHHHVFVPKDFVVPLGDFNFPKETHGLLLGRWLSNSRLEGKNEEHRQRLMEMGVKLGRFDAQDEGSAEKSV